MTRRYTVFLAIALLMALTVTTSGCGSGGDTGTAYWGGGDGGGATPQGYTVSGTLRDSITSAPVQGAACTLSQTKGGSFLRDFLRVQKETVTISTATTDQNGQYRFTGIPSGAYTLKFTKTDYIALEVSDLSVTGDTANVDRTVIQTSQWSQVAGSDAPYDATKDYVIVDASLPSKGTRPAVSGVSAIITPSTGVRLGYFTDSTPPTINWNATGTSSNGRIIFYGLTPGVQYTITFNLPGYTFPTLNVNSPSGGGVVQSYNIYATSPTPTPTSSPTPSPSISPTSSPTSSPTPTSSPSSGGGGGGGGGATGPNITAISPDHGKIGLEVTVTGTDFGDTQGNSTVSFNGTDCAIYNDWTSSSIKCLVPAGATKGAVTVNVNGVTSNADKIFTPLEITGITPVSGTPGTHVTVSGQGFGDARGTSTVTFNGTAVTAYGAWADGQFVCDAPAGFTTGAVVVTVDGQASNADKIFTPLEITGITPVSGPPGTHVTVSGQGFGDARGTSTVTFNGTAVSAYGAWADGQFVCDAPAGFTTGPIVVTVNGQASNDDKIFTLKNNYAYVANRTNSTVTVLDTTNGNALVKSITGFNVPFFCLPNADGSLVYVSNWGVQTGDTVSVIHTATIGDVSPTVDTINGFSTNAAVLCMAFSPDYKKLYVSEHNTNKIRIIDTDSSHAGTFNTIIGTITDTLNNTAGLAMTSDDRLYVGHYSGGTGAYLTVWNTANTPATQITAINTGDAAPLWLTLAPDEKRLYVGHIRNNGSVGVINTDKTSGGPTYNTCLTNLASGSVRCEGIAVTPDSRRIFISPLDNQGTPPGSTTFVRKYDYDGNVTYSGQQNINMLDPVKGNGVSPCALKVTADGQKLYVPCMGSDNMYIINAVTLVTDSIVTGLSGPFGVSFSP